MMCHIFLAESEAIALRLMERERRSKRVKFKNASGINPRLKLEELSVTLGLDPGSIINLFFAMLYSATQSKTEAS